MLVYSYIAGEGVVESVVVEEIKEVELRSRRAQFVYHRNYYRIWATARLRLKKEYGLQPDFG